MAYSIVADKDNKSIVVRLIPDISAAAIKQKQTLECGLWLRLRALNAWGSGFLDAEAAILGLQYYFGYSRSSAFRQLNKANGNYLALKWYKGRSTIKIYGLKTVSEYLSIGRFTDTHFRDIPAADFPRERTRGQLFASLAKPHGIRANSMSRETITERTGLHKVQQRRYEQREHIARTPNYAFQQSISPLDQEKFRPVKIQIFTKSKGFRSINKRLGNTYHSKQQASGRGMLRKVNAELNGFSIPAEAPTLIQRYFATFKELIKGLVRHKENDKEGSYLIPSRKRIRKGRLEWCTIDFHA